MDNLEKLKYTQREYESWQEVVSRLEAAGIDLNTNAPLTDALKTWGETLADLRTVYPLAQGDKEYYRLVSA